MMVPTGFCEIKYNNGTAATLDCGTDTTGSNIEYVSWPTGIYNWSTGASTSNISPKKLVKYVEKVQKAFYKKSWDHLYGVQPGGYLWTCDFPDNDIANTYGWCYWNDSKPAAPILTASEKLRQMIQARQSPMIQVNRKPLENPADEREVRARETLLRVIGEEKFRNFLRHGFVTVRGKSGKVYQIFPAHGITAVYDQGVMVERLCVVLTGNFPPTDSLIMRYLIILNNEDQFRAKAVKHSVTQRKQAEPVDNRPLTEIYRELRAVA